MKIAVIGATRGIGLAMTQAALADGHEVTALCRTADNFPITHEHLHIIEGNAMDIESIQQVTQGQDVVCDCLGTKNILRLQLCFPEAQKTLQALSNQSSYSLLSQASVVERG